MHLTVHGYYRHPTVHRDRIIFVAEDDLWAVSTDGGEAHRLTANPGTVSYPRLSPDGRHLAFIGRDEGKLDVFLMPSGGGSARRLTFFGSISQVVGWTPGSDSVVVASDYLQPFTGWTHLWRVPLDGGPELLPLGPARAISFGLGGKGTVIARNAFDPARWKRYRGGWAGSLWVDRTGTGEFDELVRLPGNLASPMWLGRRIFFLSDHQGVGNLYSVSPSGTGLARHTQHLTFYARFPASDGRRIVYHAGADLWLFDPAIGKTQRLSVTLPSSRAQSTRRFMAPGKYVESITLHPHGHSLAMVARGGSYTMPLWEGAPRRHGSISSERRRLATWLSDGDRVISVTDQSGEDGLVVERADGQGEPRVINGDFGRIRTLDPAPGGGRVAVTNHRHELALVELTRGNWRTLHRSPHSWVAGTAWSPDGRWLAFAAATTRTSTNIHLYDVSTGEVHRLGRPDFHDWEPSFDPEGRYLVFLSARTFEPIPDGHFHDFSFPRASVPMLVNLRADAASPFAVHARPPRSPGPPPPPEPKPADNAKTGEAPPIPEVQIDLEGIADRVVAFPVSTGIYTRARAGKGRTVFLSWPLAPLPPPFETEEPKGRLEAWDFANDKVELVAEGVQGVEISVDGKTMAVRSADRLRVVPISWKEEKNSNDRPGRETGLIDLERVRVEVNPVAEWRQMFAEAWRLQRDHFWWEDMGGVDWEEVRDRYLRLIDRVSVRSEFSDLLWEMQGELGTSHAYELGGDYRPEPKWTQGHLGADLRWDRGAWRVTRIPIGDSWDPRASSPLSAPGVGVEPGDRILSIDGVELREEDHPGSLLVDRAARTVSLGVARGRRRPRQVVVAVMADETPLRYRDWVESNRARVRELSDGAGGYIHIPDMGMWGFAEFHRYFKAEVDFPGLVIDVRFNRGGNVSQLLLEKLVRRRLGFWVTRWRQPYAFPDDSPAGSMVCLTNENAGSDGDIFSHTFKQQRLGPLIGTRTWGGVVGIWPQQSLVDGTITTQPEFGAWFTDVGFTVENYGSDPDIEVVISPQDYAAGRDPQLERGVVELLALIEKAPPLLPEFGERPSVKPPKWGSGPR
ncbi:MAG: S41 family peptidase [Actinomycetota bacterium]